MRSKPKGVAPEVLAAIDKIEPAVPENHQDLLAMIRSRSYNAQTDPYLGNDRHDHPISNEQSLELIEQPAIRIVSNSQNSRNEVYEKGVELLVSGLGMVRSAFVECQEHRNKPTSVQMEIWARTDAELRDARNQIEIKDDLIGTLTRELDRKRNDYDVIEEKYTRLASALASIYPSLDLD